MKEIDYDPKTKVAAAGVGLVEIVVLVAGLGLIGYLKANYAHDVGGWIFSLFGR
ncbi:hypothetical protein ACWGTI_22915 [Mesorhizobium sp. ArgA1]